MNKDVYPPFHTEWKVFEFMGSVDFAACGCGAMLCVVVESEAGKGDEREFELGAVA